MSENEVRDGLHDAVADEPPLSFDPDALMTTARQQVKRRRALVAVGAATVAVAVAAIALPVALGRDTPAQVAEQPSVSSPTPTREAAEWPPPDVVPVSYTVQELSQRAEEMRGHLTTVFAEVVPAATAVEVGPFSGEAEGQILEGQNYLNAAVTFTFGGERYSAMVAVYAPGAVTDQSALCGTSSTDCRDLGMTEGGPVAAETDDLQPGTLSIVFHYRRTGAMVYASAYSYDMTGRSQPGDHGTVPITSDQLERLATDPAFAL
jgi:hypothetical protein